MVSRRREAEGPESFGFAEVCGSPGAPGRVPPPKSMDYPTYSAPNAKLFLQTALCQTLLAEMIYKCVSFFYDYLPDRAREIRARCKQASPELRRFVLARLRCVENPSQVGCQ